jgi:hypothetical protein
VGWQQDCISRRQNTTGNRQRTSDHIWNDLRRNMGSVEFQRWPTWSCGNWWQPATLARSGSKLGQLRSVQVTMSVSVGATRRPYLSNAASRTSPENVVLLLDLVRIFVSGW